jgi:DHA3 family macrolide efflux protein-like MFS transporter
MSYRNPTQLWNRNFALLWIGLVQSYFGDAFLGVGLTWLILKRTGSPAAAATILVLQTIPKLLGPIAGVIVDRTNKLVLLVSCDILRGIGLVFMFVFYLLGIIEVWHFYVLVALLGAFTIFYGPALRVSLPVIVPQTQLISANSALQFGQQGALIIGASVAGMALTVFDAPLALLIDGISFLVTAVLLLFVRFPADNGQTAKIGIHEVWHDVVDGVRYIIARREVIILSLLLFFLNLILSPINVIFPVFSQMVLGAGVAGFGLLASAVSLGLLLGNVIVGIIGNRLHYTYSIIIGLIGMSVAIGALGYVQTLILALTMTTSLGMMVPFIQVPITSQLQQSVPWTHLGRVFAMLETWVMLSIPLAATLASHALIALPIGSIFRGVGIVVVLLAGSYWMMVLRGGSKYLYKKVKPVTARS